MAKFCGACGVGLAEDATFCEACGAPSGAKAAGPSSRPAAAAIGARNSYDGAAGVIVARFWGFEKMIGGGLVKAMYYLGLAGIGLAVAVGFLGGLSKMGDSPGLGLGTAVGSLLLGVVGVCFWRLFSEIFLLGHQIYNRLGEIRDRLPPTSSLG